jgi:hypothetical protein
MSDTRDLLEDALAAALQRLQNANMRTSLYYDDTFQGDHLAMHAHHLTDGHCGWEVELLNPGARVTLYAEAAAVAARVDDALAGFEGDVRFFRRLRKRIRRRMNKVASDLSRHLRTGSAWEGAPRDALQRLQRLFPGARLMVGLSRRFQTRLKDEEAVVVPVNDKRRTLRLRFAALVPTTGPDTGWRAAPYQASQRCFWLVGMTPAALAEAEARAGVSARDAGASLPRYARFNPDKGGMGSAAWEHVDSVGFCAEAGCQGADLGFLACDVFSGCDGLDGCDIGGCDL